MKESTKNVAWITILFGTIGILVYEWLRPKNSGIKGYDDVKDIKPMTLGSPKSVKTVKKTAKPIKKAAKPIKKAAKETKKSVSYEDELPKFKDSMKKQCQPVEIMQNSKSNTQVLVCPGEPLGRVYNAADAYNIMRGQLQLLQEEVVVMALDSQNNVKATSVVHRGTPNKSLLNSADVFRVPIIHGATRIILSHNHPSGNLGVSPDDIETTKALNRAGKDLGIALIDHLIISRNGFTSMRDMGLIE